MVCCGAGGVGKTTTAAAMALRAAEYGRNVVVLTIDPAKRLAQALGISDLGNSPQRVPLAPEVPGELYAMMLDMRRTFDEMVVQYSGPDRAQAILDNQFYQTVATSLAGTQEYMAMEKLGQLLSRGPLGSGGGGHAAVAQRAGLPRCAETAGQLHGQSAVAAAVGARAAGSADWSPVRSAWR